MLILPFLVLLLAGSPAPPPPPGATRDVVSVLTPLSYNSSCWSTVTLQNTGEARAAVSIEAHKGSGGLVALSGARTAPSGLDAGQKLTLRMQSEDGEENTDGWIKVTEKAQGGGPVVVVTGTTECLTENRLTTIHRAVAFPIRDPWLDAEVNEIPGRLLEVLNAGEQAAVARVCYSSGSTVSLQDKQGPRTLPVCTETVELQIPPYGLRRIPVEHGANPRVSVDTRGDWLILQMIKPEAGKVKAYTVDSTLTFLDPVK